jgi:hypothetical protein
MWLFTDSSTASNSIWKCVLLYTSSLLQSALQPWLGFGLLNCRWAISAGRFYRVPLPAVRQTPNLEENQWFRAFQLSPQEVPSVWSDASEPSSGRWNYGREMAENFAESDDFHVTLLYTYNFNNIVKKSFFLYCFKLLRCRSLQTTCTYQWGTWDDVLFSPYKFTNGVTGEIHSIRNRSFNMGTILELYQGAT